MTNKNISNEHSEIEIIPKEKILPVVGTHNLRDIGGVRTKDGKYVKMGKLFRSGELSQLTNDDIAFFDSIPIRNIVDFRDYQEVDKEPDRLPLTLEKRYHFPLMPGNLAQNIQLEMQEFSANNAQNIMREMYSELVSEPECVAQYKQFFSLIQEEENLPLLYHCTAGKDRTGIATALIYAALGVDIEDNMREYLLSNEYLEEKYGKIKQRNEFFRAILEVTPDFLNAALSTIEKNHVSIENFLRNVLDVDIEKMKKLYLK